MPAEMPRKRAAKKLVQARLPPGILRKLDALANSRRWSRAKYVENLLELHVSAMHSPKLLRTLDQLPPERAADKS